MKLTNSKAGFCDYIHGFTTLDSDIALFPYFYVNSDDVKFSTLDVVYLFQKFVGNSNENYNTCMVYVLILSMAFFFKLLHNKSNH